MKTLPKNYAVILDVLRTPGEKHHRTASEIYDETRRRHPKLGAATVHRGLHRLIDLGLVSKLELPGSDAARYEPVVSAHAHFACRRCGAVKDVAAPMPPELVARVERMVDADIDPEAVSFVGVCRSCSGRR